MNKYEKIREDCLFALKNGLEIGFSRSGSASNTMRKGKYKNKAFKIDLSGLDQIKIDDQTQTAVVEPAVSMEKLFNELFKAGFMPKVLPEFKGITVGGAINGAALESSSYRHGQFNNSCKSFTLLTGDLQIRTLSDTSHKRLFHAVSGSFGSLGLLLNAVIEVEKAKPYVTVSYQRFDDLEKALNFMENSIKEKSSDFIEGLLFSRNNILIVEGCKSEKRDPACPALSLKNYFSPWYYQHLNKRSQDSTVKEQMTLKDYLFRHDRGAFWMSGYALHPSVLKAYMKDLLKIGKSGKFSKDLKPACKTPFWFRLLFGKIVDSKRLYKFLHHDTESFFSDHFCIQDYYLPFSKAGSFISHVLDLTGIAPIWLCPIKKSSHPEIFSPHYQPDHKEDNLIDIGVYGLVKPGINSCKAVFDLDHFCTKLGGKKMLYSHCYWTEEEFWSIYSKKDYETLREKYLAKGMFIDIQKKVLEN